MFTPESVHGASGTSHFGPGSLRVIQIIRLENSSGFCFGKATKSGVIQALADGKQNVQ
jgi:hypothetical protein